MKLDVSPGLLHGGYIRLKNLPDSWQEGRGELLLRQLVPVQVLIPPVVLDVVCPILKLTVSLGHVSHEQVLN